MRSQGVGSISDEAGRLLTLNTEPWFSCDECFDTVDVAIEQLLLHRAPFSAPFRTHLMACGACLEEARLLLGLLARDRNLDAKKVIARLDRELLA